MAAMRARFRAIVATAVLFGSASGQGSVPEKASTDPLLGDWEGCWSYPTGWMSTQVHFNFISTRKAAVFSVNFLHWNASTSSFARNRKAAWKRPQRRGAKRFLLELKEFAGFNGHPWIRQNIGGK